ncbi:uncharacterized protein LOC131650564 [Vicia villosa]|uniref:uncharacterized protein LOC131650564 n=1 Tax=Vicia villosa TaxID=3911 RepID=UPI00273A9A3A|nr:uncharacterized protein LOC131650564 [Vicia villosa]
MIALIPKVNNPIALDEFRPIFLVGSVYKIFAKLLAGRLKLVFHKLISKCQTAFAANRQLLDGVLVSNEVVVFAKRVKRKCMLVKVDFEKAYDCVSWDFLRSMLKRMDFGDQWCGWMETLGFNSSMSVFVNGSPTTDFNVARGLCQGDPISPFLFLLVAEVFSGLMHQAVSLGEFKPFRFNDSTQVDLLQFADNTILIGEGFWKNLWSIKALLRGFELVSDLRENLSKSKLYGINLDVDFLQAITFFLSCSFGTIPFVFLDIPIAINSQRQNSWAPIVSKIRRKLVVWHNKFLSIDGSMFLLNSVLSNIPICFFSFYKAPKVVLKEITSSKELSLGVVVKILKMYGNAKWEVLSGSCGNKKASLWWRDVCLIGEPLINDPHSNWFYSSIFCKLGDERSLDFWRHCSLGSSSFEVLFPYFYRKSGLGYIKVIEVGGWFNEIWKWDLGFNGGDFEC